MRILLFEDNPGDARLVQEILSEIPDNFTVNVVERLELGLEFLASQDVDVVLLDLNLPDSRGLETLTKLQTQFSHVPVVIMTGSDDEALGVRAVKLGAQDYLVKGQVDSRLLRRALKYAVERKQMEQRLIVQERLAYLGRMAGTIAHEVRNPLATVDASAYYLEKTLKDTGGKTKEHLQRIRDGITRAAKIIEKLLQMSRVKEPSFSVLDLSQFAAKALSATTAPRNIKVVLNQQAGAIVRADEEQLNMAIGNLLRNAIEAMGQGGTLTVSVGKPDNWAELSVSDTGPGISPGNQERLFEPLFTTKPGGVGFGLSLAKTVVERHSGSIEVESEPGKGATFIIRLPLYVEEARVKTE